MRRPRRDIYTIYRALTISEHILSVIPSADAHDGEFAGQDALGAAQKHDHGYEARFRIEGATED